MRGTERYPDWAVIGICFLVALFEGFDIQSMGVAAPRLAPALGLTPDQTGIVLSSSIAGAAIGAAIGGRAADRHGRRTVLMVAMALLGIFSFATAYAADVWSLTSLRVLAGLGLGGVFPNLLALGTEAAPQRHRVTILGLVYCGLPLGGALAGTVASVTRADDWATIFLVGGFGPLLLIPAIAAWVPRLPIAAPAEQRTARAEEWPSRQLFGVPIGLTILLWLAFFLTPMAVYTLLNWLPSLMVAKGQSRIEAAHASIFLNIGAVIGSLVLGRIADRVRLTGMLVATYVGMGLSLGGLILAHGTMLQAAAFNVGFFVIGGQLILYSLPSVLYPRVESGKGIGAAIAVGRVGSIIGPVAAGLILSSNLGANAVALFAELGLTIALIAALRLSVRARLGEFT